MSSGHWERGTSMAATLAMTSAAVCPASPWPGGTQASGWVSQRRRLQGGAAPGWGARSCHGWQQSQQGHTYKRRSSHACARPARRRQRLRAVKVRVRRWGALPPGCPRPPACRAWPAGCA